MDLPGRPRDIIGGRPTLTNAILFVTQVPQPLEANNNVVSNVFLGVGRRVRQSLADTVHSPRGGTFGCATKDGTLVNLTRLLGYGVAGAQHHERHRRARAAGALGWHSGVDSAWLSARRAPPRMERLLLATYEHHRPARRPLRNRESCEPAANFNNVAAVLPAGRPDRLRQ